MRSCPLPIDTWVMPQEALENGQAGSWEVPFPTQRHLEMLAGHDSIASVLAHATATEVQSVLPRIVLGDNGEYQVRLPGDPGYEEKVGT